MNVDFKGPTPESVGAFYDQVNAIIAKVQGGSMHHGYWTGPDDDSDFETASARLTDLMIERVGARPGERVLDVGCGLGWPGVRLAKTSGAELVGVSVSEQDVRLANERARAEAVSDRVGFERADMLALPFPDDSFDHAMAFESIVHVHDRVRALREIARVVRPGGRVVLTDFTVKEGPDGRSDQTLVKVYDSWRVAAVPIGAEDYKTIASQAGLVLDEVTDITDHVKYTSMWTYLELRRFARDNPVPPEVEQILDVFGPTLKGTVDSPPLTDAQLEQGWRKMLAEEQVQGMIVVIARTPSA
ncbi:Methyltransferase domain-containing protein [Micromonospora phaseoli]|uniref:Methyltransferase domain-containing protein n=1 Tax=Micromonospora phaseoli TaxID=1144548 RepID=A0A1H7ACD9_9ACTN|nr:methyltransferase domain-containing protein [Micromonospora phaseoli]PZV96490.1 methyltransferase family protein [Micromonospora phaseoli]GIJ76179.1 methyltransferase type 11 [Micromonospora phaseoli]SEJ62606.1 Methyltransferase domain-containing protein [Micromonospora phaseoli]